MKQGRLFGTVKLATDSLDRKEWHITTEPQVAVRLKRVFERIEKSDIKYLRLADTIENARELEWFLERYPMTVEPKAYLAKRAREHRQREARIGEMLSEDYVPTEFELALPPRPYQRLAADLVIDRGSLLLGDDVGIGKTVSAICALAAEGSLPALVVTLTHLPKQWEAELKRFAPDLRVHRIRKGTPYDLTLERGQRVRHPDVIISNYNKLTGWGEELSGRIKTVVFDEVQELRHRTGNERQMTLKYAAAKMIADGATRRMGLSATPIYNYGGEIFNVMDVLAPGALGTTEEFRREWCGVRAGYGGQDKLTINDPVAFGMYLREQGLMLRRTRKDVGRELPPLTKVYHYVEANEEILDRIKTSAAELARVILRPGGSGFSKMRAAEELDWKLRQATGVAKAPYVAAFVRMLVESGEPVLLYGWHREVYSLWGDLLGDLEPAFYTGTESQAQKQRAKDRFMSGETNVLIMSLRAGAGLDGLQARGHNVVFGELDWSPQVHTQCIGREHRDGQMHGVMAYFLIADTGSDPSVIEALGFKRQQSDGVMDPEIVIEADGQVEGDDKLVKGAPVDRIKKLAEQFLSQHTHRKPVDLVDEEAA